MGQHGCTEPCKGSQGAAWGCAVGLSRAGQDIPRDAESMDTLSHASVVGRAAAEPRGLHWGCPWQPWAGGGSASPAPTFGRCRRLVSGRAGARFAQRRGGRAGLAGAAARCRGLAEGVRLAACRQGRWGGVGGLPTLEGGKQHPSIAPAPHQPSCELPSAHHCVPATTSSPPGRWGGGFHGCSNHHVSSRCPHHPHEFQPPHLLGKGTGSPMPALVHTGSAHASLSCALAQPLWAQL